MLLTAIALILCTQTAPPPASAPPAEPALKTTEVTPPPAKPAPITDAERPFLGCWRLDIDSLIAEVMKDPTRLPSPTDMPHRTAASLFSWVPSMTFVTVDLREDRSAVVQLPPQGFVSTWTLENGEAVVTTPWATWKMTVRRVGEKGERLRLIDGREYSLNGPLQPAPKTKDATIAAVAGEWALDREASVKARRDLLKQTAARLPALKQEILDGTLEVADRDLERIFVGFTIEGAGEGGQAGKEGRAVTTWKGGKTRPASVLIAGDGLILAPDEWNGVMDKKTPWAPVCLRIDGERLITPWDRSLLVFTRVKRPAADVPGGATPAAPATPPVPATR